MPSSSESLEHWTSRLAGAGTITSRKMMGEYLLYADGKLFGGIYDDRLLIKITKVSATMFQDAESAFPYEGGSEMILIDSNTDDMVLCRTVRRMLPELPAPRKR